MSEGHEGRDSENNWVIPSAENFPVETVGAAQGGAEEVGAAGLESALPPVSEETVPDVTPGPEFTEGPTHHEKAEEPEKLDEEQDWPPNTEGPRGPSIVGGDLEEVSCSSSDDDVEGLRKRVGRGSPPASVGPSVREAMEQDPDGGYSLNLNVLVIAAVGLLCVGVLVFSGSSFNTNGDPTQSVVSRSVTGGDEQSPQVITDIQDWIEQHAEQFTGDARSLQLMSGLLDRVAKENQEIRHMQATLQAQKEELEALLSVSDGRNITSGLAEENIRLKDALLTEETAHLSAKEELLNVQEKLEVLESGGVKEALAVENSQLKVDLDALKKQIESFLAQKETLVAESQMLRQELNKQRLLVTSIRQDLDNLVAKSDEGEDGTLLQERLSEMSSRLAMEAQRSETWEKKYVEHAHRRKEQVGEKRRDHDHKEWKKVDISSKTPNISTPGGDFRKTHYKHVKEHGKRWTEDKQEEHMKKKHDDKHWQDNKHQHGEKAGVEILEDKETWKSKSREHSSKESARHHHNHHEKQARHHRGEAEAGFHPRKGQKDFTDSHRRREDREKDHRHHDHNKFWKKLSDHQYRVPEGCSGLEDCARKDGMDLFSVELKPVQRKQFEEVLLNYLTKSQLSDHLPELTPLLDGFFDGPLFSHHKIRFKDFVDDVEDFLEDLARKEMGNDDIVDDFERYVYASFFEEGINKKRCAKDEQQKTSKCHNQYGQLKKTYNQSINQSNHNKPFTTDLHVDSHDFKPIKKYEAHENDKIWSPNSKHEEESGHKYHNKDHLKTHHQSPKRNTHDKNDGSFYHRHHAEKPKYPHTKLGGEAEGQHHDGHHFHNIKYKEYGVWQMPNHDKHKYDPKKHSHQNTNKEQQPPDERFGKESFKYKHKSPEKYRKDEEDHKHNPKKQEKNAQNNHYQSSQRHKSHNNHSTDHKSWRDGNQQRRQTDTFHKKNHGPTQRYPSKAYNHRHKENEGRPEDYHPHQHDVHDRHGNYHQKHGKNKHVNYHQLHERSKDSDWDYYHKYDKDHHKHEDGRDYHQKYDKDHHKHEDDRDYHQKYDKDHHKHGDHGNRHKYDKDHHNQGDDKNYQHKYDKDNDKHGDDRDRNYHHKYLKDHHKRKEAKD